MAKSIKLCLLLEAILFLSAAGSPDSSCTPTVFEYPRFLNLMDIFPTPDTLNHPDEVLIPTYTFRCSGYITGWEAYTMGRGAHGIEFQVWRLRMLNTYDLIGINVFPNAQPTGNLLRLTVPENEWIHMERGDFVGIRTLQLGNSTENEVPFQIQSVANQGRIMDYRFNLRYNETPTVLDISGFLFFTFVHNTPIINAILQDNSTTVITPATSTPLPQSTIISIAALGSILALLGIIFVLVLMLTCCKWCASRKSQVKGNLADLGTSRQSGIAEMAYNTAYCRDQVTPLPIPSPAAHLEPPTVHGSSNEDPYYTQIGSDGGYIHMS